MTPNAEYVGHLIDRDHEFLGCEPHDFWRFEGVCSCGFRSYGRTATIAHNNLWYHIQRMKWRKEDAEWRSAISGHVQS